MSAPVTSVKITTVGNSLGIVLPRDVLQRLHVDKGDQLYLVETRGGVELMACAPDVLAQIEALERTARHERTVLRGLAGRDTAKTGLVVRTHAASQSATVLSGTVLRGTDAKGGVLIDETARAERPGADRQRARDASGSASAADRPAPPPAPADE